MASLTSQIEKLEDYASRVAETAMYDAVACGLSDADADRHVMLRLAPIKAEIIRLTAILAHCEGRGGHPVQGSRAGRQQAAMRRAGW